MPIIGFSFTKIIADKKELLKPDTKLESHIDILRIEEEKNTTLGKEGLLRFDFSYNISYGIYAKIEFEGNILFMTSIKEAKDILVKWQKNKNMDPELSTLILNAMLHKCNIRALELEDSINLPPHIRLPYAGTKPSEDKKKDN